MKKKFFLFSLLIVTMTMQAASVIRNEATATAGQWICFRKTITVSSDNPSVNTLRIAADSKYWLWVNGKEEVFEGQLKRGPNASDTYLDTLSLKNLKTGSNTIAVLVWYFGRNGFSHKSSGCPGLYFDLSVGDDHFGSDESWFTKIHPAYYVPSGDTPNYRLPESNVGFDARKNLSDWTSSSFDNSSWSHATAISTENAGWGNFTERPIPYWKDFGEKSYVSLTTSSSNIICKLPYNAQITPCLTVRAKAGLTIGIKTDDYQPTGENSVRAEYITKDGLQSYESLGWMNGHEVIYTIPEGVEVVSLSYRETGYNCELAGSFTCDDADLNSLWTKAQRTLYLTMRDNFMDCPDRERAQWIGDFGIELEEIFYALSPKADLLSSKCLHEFASWQRSDGILHAPVPEGNYDVELPQQCLAAMGLGAWNYYIGTADSKTISDVFPAWKRYMHIWEMGSNNLVTYRSGGWDWGDWGSNQDMQALCQFWYSIALDYYARQADLIGESSEAEWARNINAKMKPALQSTLWTGEVYRHPSYTGSTDDRTQAMAVLSGVADSTKYATLHNILTKTQYASPYMERFVLEALCQMGYIDDAISRMRSRYQPMIDSEYSTLWELFTLSGGTYNHAWSGGPLIILSKYVAGVQPLEAGFKKFLVRPQLGSLHHVETVVPSVSGNISVKARNEGYLTLEVTVPEGTTAVLSVPSKYADISINDKSATFSLTADGKFKETSVEFGTYVIKAREIDTSKPLITSVSQLSSNGHHENYVTDNLIDNDTTSYFHAVVDGTWKTPDWSTYDSHIQVELNKSISKFFLRTNRRYNSGNDDNDNMCCPPKIFEIKASNDGIAWDSITTISDMPNTAGNWPYTSPLINLGKNYKYVRFYCRSVYGYNYSYWCLSELQMYPEEDETTYFLNKAITEGKNLLQLTVDKEALIYEANDEDAAHNQFSSNARWTYLDAASGGQGSYTGLIDGNYLTYFHSAYPGAPKTYSYLQVDLKRTDISKFTIEMLRRGDGNWNDAWNQMPNNIDIYATNDTSAYNAETSNASWHYIATLDSGFPTCSSHNYYISPLVKMENPYQYLRFTVKGTEYGGKNDAGYPFFNMSEFQLYSDEPAASSEYFIIDGMKNACNVLKELITEEEEKMDTGTAEISDTTALNATIASVKALYVDKNAVESMLTTKLNEATAVYHSAFVYDELVTTASQISTAGTTSGSLSSLIDNNLASTVTISGSVALNQSATYLKFNFNRSDVSQIIVSFNGCAGSDKNTPSALDIYASSDNKTFKRAAGLTKGFPNNVDNAYYCSPTIELGADYGYVRVVPVDVAGVVNPMKFSVSEMHIFNGNPNQNKSPYYSNEELRKAVDALKQLMDETQTKVDKHLAINMNDSIALNNAMQTVRDLLNQVSLDVNTIDNGQKTNGNNTIYNDSGMRVTNRYKGIQIRKGHKYMSY